MDTLTDRQTKYSNPRCACAPRVNDHNMSPASCKTGSFQGKLGSYPSAGSVGTTSHTGLPSRPFSIPYTVKGALRNTPSTGAEGCLAGDLKTFGERAITQEPRQALFSAFSRPKKGWWPKASNQSEGLKQVRT